MIWQSELRCLQPRIWLQNPLSILCASCYTIRATQSNNEIAFEGITLVKSVFSFTRTLERRRDCVATIRDALFRCVSQIGAHFLFALNSYLSMERGDYMGTKSNKNISGVIGAIGAVGGLITAVTPLVEKAIDNAQNKPTEKIDTKVIIPELYRKGFPIDLEQAEELLTERGLKVSKSKLRMKEADPKYRDYEDTQVIDSNPKQGVKVKIGTTVCLRYITAEVIEESQKIFDDSVRIKQEAKEQKAAEKQEKKERLKESVSETMDSAKSGLEKIFKKDRKAIEAEKGEK
jgi:hypothetical protein